MAALLAVCLVVLGYLLGQRERAAQTEEERAATASVSTAATPQLGLTPLSVGTPKDLDSRLDALEKRVQARQQQVGRLQQPDEPSHLTPTAAAAGPIDSSPIAVEALPSTSPAEPSPTSKGATVARADYFQRVDAIVGRSAFSTSSSMAGGLLERAVLGGEPELDRLLDGTRKATAAVKALTPPAECQQHHALLLGQLSGAATVLAEVKVAMQSGDREKLRLLTASVESSQAQAVQLSELDRALRQGL
jgi:hypothetical protein